MEQDSLSVSHATRDAFRPILGALAEARRSLAADPNVVAVRPGYDSANSAAPVPALVVAVVPGTSSTGADELRSRLGLPVVVLDATIDEQVAKMQARPLAFSTPGAPPTSPFETLLAGRPGPEFAPPNSGSYQEPQPSRLVPVQEAMDLTICVSPEAGWSELESFLTETTSSLAVAMYQFTAPHIFEAVEKAVTPVGRKFELVLHPIPEKPPRSGVKAHDLDEKEAVIEPLESELRDRFRMAWATLRSATHPDGLWASAYHIKVAVRDGSVVWLSSGNWQSSNQPDVHLFGDAPDDPPAGFQRRYNRDYHVIAESKSLAEIFEFYINRDFELASAQATDAVPFAAPDLFVPEEEAPPVDFAAPPRFFEPLRINRQVKVQPLLTPDNYAEHALDLIRSAARSVWFQNQYINMRGTDEDFVELRLLVGALKAKLDAGVEVRIICRDLMKQESLDILLALGFPREVFRFQAACHNKAIIVDRRAVMFGSHNWSNEGVRTNRDASMIFDDQEIAGYLAGVYDYDWTTLATAHPTAIRPRVARDGEATPPGMQRVAFSAYSDD